MKKIFLLLVLLLCTLYGRDIAEIDEYKVDLYYANGIMMQDSAEQAEDTWKVRVDDLLSAYPQLQTNVGDIKVSYNLSEGMVADMWESFLQKVQLENTYKIGWFGF